jgi:hypothetical protein
MNRRFDASGGIDMSARNWLILAGITGVLSVRPALAGSIPLPRGQFAFTLSGSLAICLNPTTFAEESCSTTGVLVVPLTGLGNGAVTWDKNHSCASTVETDADFPPDAFPPFLVTDEHIVRTVTTYDSSTGTGDESFTAYRGGKCNGASFDRTGAAKFASGTDHFVVSEQGKRIDFELTTLTNPSDAAGGFSLSGVNRAQ